jgi:acetoin utilization deacetylase AcuC-like enzyme
MATGYLTHPSCLLHEMPFHHPEAPARLAAVNDALIESRLMPYLDVYEAPAATDEELERAHSRDYVAWVRSKVPETGYFEVDPDTYMNPHTFEAALHAAGAAVKATDLVLGGEMTNAFCAVRPPGHHATRDQAMGFCFFNNVAVGATHALARHGLERIAIVDFDVHQGNGTVDILGDDPRVLFCSTYQHPFYPFAGPSAHEGVVDVPLPAGSGSQAFRAGVEHGWLPRIDRFAPQMIFISAGFDAHHRDDLAHFDLAESDFAWVTDKVVELASRHAEGRIVSVLEGGYDLAALGASVCAHIRALLGL